MLREPAKLANSVEVLVIVGTQTNAAYTESQPGTQRLPIREWIETAEEIEITAGPITPWRLSQSHRDRSAMLWETCFDSVTGASSCVGFPDAGREERPGLKQAS